MMLLEYASLFLVLVFKTLVFILLLCMYISLYFLVQFIRNPVKQDLDKYPPSFFIFLSSIGMGWLVDEIKTLRFMILLFITALSLYPRNFSVLAWYTFLYRTVLGSWRLYVLLRMSMREKREKEK